MTAIGILGLVAIIGDDGEPAVLRTARRRLLLALLATRHGRVVDGAVLVDAMWPEELPAHPEAALQSQVHHLRRQLGTLGTQLLTDAPGYRLACPPDAVDALRFERLLVGIRAGTPVEEAIADLEAASTLWRGPAFGDVAEHELLRDAAGHLDGLRADAAERRIELLLAAGRDVEAEHAAATLTAEQPHREGPVALHMRALARLGRHADGLRAFGELRRRLVDDLGVEPSPALRAAERRLLTHDSAPAVGVPGNSFVGRGDEVVSAVELLSRVRLVTFTGPGGVGKTRLALHTAAALADRFAGGVVLCELAPVGRSDAVAGAVASALGIDERGGRDLRTRIVELLRGSRALLVLDNCEHVVEGVAALVEAVLARTSGVVVLATSRRRLGVPGEHAVPVGALDVGEGGAAIELFVDRVAAVRPDLRPSTDDEVAMAEIGRLLDGLPLAIELAAARMLSRTPMELLAELRRDAPVDERASADRHRSVDATIDWSYALLSAEEQALYRRMAVFAGGWTREAADAVVAGGGGDAIDALVEHSLVLARTVEGGTRFAMLEPVRQHAASRLGAAGEAADALARHAAWAVRFIEEADAGLRSDDEVRWASAIARELGNLRAAHRWALDHDAIGARRIVAALYWYDYFHGPAEIVEWADATVERLTADEAEPSAVGALATAALGACRRGDLDRACRLGERAVALDRGRDPSPGARFARTALRSALGLAGDQLGALEQRDAVVALARLAGDTVHEAHAHALGALALGYLGRRADAEDDLDAARRLLDVADNPSVRAMCAYVSGEVLVETAPAEALDHLRESRAIAAAAGNDFIAAIAGVSAVSSATRLGDPAVTIGQYRDVIASFRRGGVWPQLWTTLRTLVEALARAGRDDDAAVLLGAVRATASGAPIRGADAERLATVEASLADRLGPEQFGVLLAEGAALGDEAAVARALAAVDALS